MIIHYNCTIGSFLLHYFLLIYHLYPPSFHEMIFTLVPLIFFVSLGDSRINRVRDCIAFLSMLTVRVLLMASSVFVVS